MIRKILPLVFLPLVTIAGAPVSASAQTKEDRAIVEKARLAYFNHPVPSSISCQVILDWDQFVRDTKMEMDEASKARVEKLKAAKIGFTSKSSGETEVKVEAPEGFSTVESGIRQQISGFFQMYWAESYGRTLSVKPDENFELTKMDDGYKISSASGSTKIEIGLDKSNAITSEDIRSPQMNAVMKPVYKPGDDSLLRLRSLEETIEFGATKMVIDVDLDYQKVSGFEVPQHVHVALPGSFAFNYTFVGCDVKGEDKEPDAKKIQTVPAS